MIEIFFIVSLFVLGACIGSFINALNWRYVNEKSMWDRSMCPHCKHKLAPFELIPIFSFLLQKGRCRKCNKKISFRYPVVEFVASIVFGFIGFFVLGKFGANFGFDYFLSVPYLFYLLFISASLIAVTAADLSWGIIPDIVVLPAIVISIIYPLYDFLYRNARYYFILKKDPQLNGLLPPNSDFFTNVVKEDLTRLFYSFIFALVILSMFFLLVRLSKGRAMGQGDIKLAFLIGLVVGWPVGLISLFTAFLTGALASVMLILVRRKKFGGTVPFGPFLSLGAFIGIFYGTKLLEFYLNLMR